MLAAACALQAEPATPEGPVVDTADVLSPPVEHSLDRRLRDYWEQKEAAIVVATVPSLKGETIEVAARNLYDNWGIGSAKTNRGVLLLIAPDEKKARIEVGCGLETVVSDEAAQKIMDDVMVPRFKANDFDAGTTAAVTALIDRIDTANVPAGPVTPYCVEIMKDAA